jgi:acetyltransferase
MDFPEIKEIDINPFAVDEKGGVVLDAKVVLDEQVISKPVRPYSHMVISPYPKEYVSKFKTNKGLAVTLRPIRPEDEELAKDMFSNLSERTQQFRFFQTISEISHEQLVRYTQIDYDREISILAEIEENGAKKMAGMVRLVKNPFNEDAEFSVVVADPHQGQGLGGKLTDYILEIAKQREIKRVYADFSTDNKVMHHIFEKKGFKISSCGDMCHAELVLKS